MILFLAGEISIILAGLVIISGHIGLASKILIASFFLILIAVFIYLIRLISNDKK